MPTNKPADSRRGLIQRVTENWVAIYFGVAVLLIVFGYGMAAGVYKLFPYSVLQDGVSAARDWVSSGKQYARIKPDKHLRKARRPGAGVARYNEDKASQGVTLMAGMWGEQLGFRLVDMAGNILHEWEASFNSTWPQASHLKFQPHDWDTAIHGMVAYPDGRIVFNYEHNGLVALNQCSEVLWKIGEETHHAVFRAEDDTLWVANNTLRTENVPEFPLLSAPFWEETLVQIAPEGDILQRISLLEIMHKSGYEGFLVDPTEHVAGTNWTGTVASQRQDITHLNDIEVLPAAMADYFDLFSAGDILVSLRNIDLLLVIDPNTQTIKWSQTGPWLMQHDPDFQTDGSILVFDNRARRYGMDQSYGSRILQLDPVSRATTIFYEGSVEDPFYTSQMGKLQRLPNGNVLITEPEGGRVFEVNDKGETVWEYINRWSDTEVAFISDSIRLPVDFFQFPKVACK